MHEGRICQDNAIKSIVTWTVVGSQSVTVMFWNECYMYHIHADFPSYIR
jgi:hypothetical protein